MDEEEGLGPSCADNQTTKGEAEGPAPKCSGHPAGLQICQWPPPGGPQSLWFRLKDSWSWSPRTRRWGSGESPSSAPSGQAVNPCSHLSGQSHCTADLQAQDQTASNALLTQPSLRRHCLPAPPPASTGWQWPHQGCPFKSLPPLTVWTNQGPCPPGSSLPPPHPTPPVPRNVRAI